MPQMLRNALSVPRASAGIHHRDITAKNIMAYTDCRFKVIDFGMAAPAESLKTKEAIPSEYPKRVPHTSSSLC